MGGQDRRRTLWGLHRGRLEALERDVTGSREDPHHIKGWGVQLSHFGTWAKLWASRQFGCRVLL